MYGKRQTLIVSLSFTIEFVFTYFANFDVLICNNREYIMLSIKLLNYVIYNRYTLLAWDLIRLLEQCHLSYCLNYSRRKVGILAHLWHTFNSCLPTSCDHHYHFSCSSRLTSETFGHYCIQWSFWPTHLQLMSTSSCPTPVHRPIWPTLMSSVITPPQHNKFTHRGRWWFTFAFRGNSCRYGVRCNVLPEHVFTMTLRRGTRCFSGTSTCTPQEGVRYT